jgi:hypothetical protein
MRSTCIAKAPHEDQAMMPSPEPSGEEKGRSGKATYWYCTICHGDGRESSGREVEKVMHFSLSTVEVMPL